MKRKNMNESNGKREICFNTKSINPNEDPAKLFYGVLAKKETKTLEELIL